MVRNCSGAVGSAARSEFLILVEISAARFPAASSCFFRASAEDVMSGIVGDRGESCSSKLKSGGSYFEGKAFARPLNANQKDFISNWRISVALHKAHGGILLS